MVQICKVAEALYEFWEEGFHDVQNLMDFVHKVGSFVAYLYRHFIYGNNYLTMGQDYIKTISKEQLLYTIRR
jgi:hypothetical protein